jgi:hypothetical protein
MQLTNNNDDPFLHIAFSGVQIFTSVPSSATSDPHLIGATGSNYEFDGEPGGTYTLFQRHNSKWSCTWPGMGRALCHYYLVPVAFWHCLFQMNDSSFFISHHIFSDNYRPNSFRR